MRSVAIHCILIADFTTINIPLPIPLSVTHRIPLPSPALLYTYNHPSIV